MNQCVIRSIFVVYLKHGCDVILTAHLLPQKGYLMLRKDRAKHGEAVELQFCLGKTDRCEWQRVRMWAKVSTTLFPRFTIQRPLIIMKLLLLNS